MPNLTTAETRAKAKAFDDKMAAMAAEPRAARRTVALQRVARAGGPIGAEAKRILASAVAANANKARAAELAALPKSIVEAGSAAEFSKAEMRRHVAQKYGDTAPSAGRTSMLEEMQKLGIKPAA